MPKPVEKSKRSWKRTEPGIKELAKLDSFATTLVSFGGSRSRVEIRSDPKMFKNRLFEVKIGDEKAIIDVDQLLWYTRLF